MSRATQDTARPRHATNTELSSSVVELSRTFFSQSKCQKAVLQPRTCTKYTCGLGWSPVARHYWGNHCYFLFLEVLRCFSSLRSPPYLNIRIATLQVAGLSHSEIAGSRVICTYPALIAAYHVLHRLREPRHPPCALYYFRQ